MRGTISAAVALAVGLAACAQPTTLDDCEAATATVSECYGADVATVFAETCDAEAVAEVVASECDEGEIGKADGFFPTYIDPDREEHFKYGSMGADYRGLPAPVFRALPLVCSDLWRERAALPASADPMDHPYEAFGMVYEAGHDMPIGVSTRRMPFVGVELTGPNCSTCHTAVVRETESSAPRVYLGAPGAQFDLESYQLFVLDCVLSADFTTSNIRAAFRALGERSYLLPYVAPFLDVFVRDARRLIAAIVSDGPWGPGRDDAIGLSAAFLLGEEHIPPFPSPVDYPSSWNQDERRGGRLHWDGAAGSAEERNVLVSIGSGTPDYKVPFSSLDAIQSWLEELEPPPYPFAIDDAAAARGEVTFDTLCASCHSRDGERFGDVVPLDEIGTDPNRVLATTDEGADALNALRGPGWRFGGFENTDGYVNGLLDGAWLRAPYLHNGSVPTLRDLLRPANDRPQTFYRGYTVYDQDNVGYVSTVPPRENEPTYGLLDTTRDGNANTGHEYGTELTADETEDLLAYLRTL